MILSLLVAAAVSDEPAPSPDAPPIAAADQEAAAAYRMGLDLAAASRYEEACSAYLSVLAHAPDSTTAAAARRQMAQIAPLVPSGNCGVPAGSEPTERRDRSGTTDLIVSQTLLSTAWWALVPAGGLGVEEPSLFLVGGLVGLGSGLGGTIAYTRNHDVTEGQVAALNLGEALGGWHGVAFVVVAGPGDAKPYFLAPGLGVVGGGIIGALAASNLRPSPGQSALASHCSGWGAYTGAISLLIAQPESRLAVLAPLAGSDLGLGLGLYLASRFPDTSRSHVRLVSLGGATGAVTTAIVLGLVVLGGTELSAPTVGTTLFVGTGLGLAGAIALTRDMDRADHQVRRDVFIMPTLPSVSRDVRGTWTVNGGLSGVF